MSADSLSNSFAQMLYNTQMPLISTAAPGIVREMISTHDDAGQLGRATIEGQLELYNQSLDDLKNRTSEAGQDHSLEMIWSRT
jgi:hypothetical protein